MTAGNRAERGGPPSVKFTYQDLLDLPGDGQRHEIVDGEHIVTPSPNTRHQQVLMNLAVALSLYLRQHPIGAIFVAPLDVVLSDADVVEPDLLYVSRERAHIITEQNIQGAPDLVVEILSPGTRTTDEVTKRALYERAGVTEYWLVDPELERIALHRRHARPPDAFVAVAPLGAAGGDVLTTPLLPGFSLPARDVFAAPV